MIMVTQQFSYFEIIFRMRGFHQNRCVAPETQIATQGLWTGIVGLDA